MLYKGSRFLFEIELVSTHSEEDKKMWATLLSSIHHNSFRIGSGTRKGFGAFKVIECTHKQYNLSEATDLNAYAEKSSDINIPPKDFTTFPPDSLTTDSKWINYTLSLTPDDFMLFGAGHGNDEADITPKQEQIISWNGQTPSLEKNLYYLIPATSVKGAIAHRVAFHYNRLTGNFSNTIEAPQLNIDETAIETEINQSLDQFRKKNQFFIQG